MPASRTRPPYCLAAPRGAIAAASRKLLIDHVPHAAGGVVERHRLHIRMSAKEVAALVERDRMREHPSQIAQFHPRRRDQVVPDAQREFAMDEHVACQQQVEVLGDRTRQRVFDGNDGRIDAACFEPRRTLRPSARTAPLAPVAAASPRPRD